MRHAWLIVAKDMRRRLRSPVSLLCMLSIPLVMTLVVGLIFGSEGKVEVPRITLLLVDEDGGFVSNFFKQGLRQGKLAEMIDLREVERAEGEALMASGKASALLEIPKGFTEAVLDRAPAELRLLKNPSETFLPLIAEEIVKTMAVVLEGSARVFAEPIAGLRGMIDGGGWPSTSQLEPLLASARSRIALVRGYLADSLVTVETVAERAEAGGVGSPDFNLFAFLLPGSILLGLLFIGEIAMRDLLREREARTLARMIAGPVEPSEVLLGKVLSAIALTALSCVLLLLVGRFAFGIPWGDPAALAAAVVGAILMCTGIVAFVYGIIRSERAADTVLPIVIIVLCLVGGSMLPYESMNEGMRAAARLSPVFWASEAIKSVSIAGAGLQEIAGHLAVVYGVGVATLAAGALLLGGRLRRGGW